MKEAAKTFLVIGGAGFIGSATVEHLLLKDHRVAVLDNFSTGRRENLEFEGTLDKGVLSRLTIFEGDIRNADDIREAMEGAEYVIHEAALTSVQESIISPVLTNSVNVDGLLNCLVAAKELGIERFVFASSSSVYGNSSELPNKEMARLEPESPYAVTKTIGERYCHMFSSVYGLETVVLRYFNVFGPGQSSDSEYSAVIPCFITRLLSGEKPVIFGDGEQSRDFTYVQNVAVANYLASLKSCVSGRAINIGSGERKSLKELLSTLKSIVGSSETPIFAEPRPCDVKHSWASMEEAKTMLGFIPHVSFEEGLRRTVSYLRDGMKGRARPRE